VCVCVRGYLKIKLFDARGAEKGVGVGWGVGVRWAVGWVTWKKFSIFNVLFFSPA
jgi:hypothetical protein